MLIVSCDEEESAPNSNNNIEEEDLENTLDDLLTGQEGNIEDYFYNLSSEQIDAEYHYYDPNAMSNPQFFFEPSTDRLNFYTFPCYLVSLTQNDLDESLTTRSLEDSSTMHIEQEINISSDRYSNIIKMVWNEEDARYSPQIESNLQEDTTYIYIPDSGLDGCLDSYEAGDGSCLDEEDPDYTEGDDPNGDNYNETENPDGTESDGVYNSGNEYTDIYNHREYKVNYDLQEMGDIEGMYYLDTNEWVSNDSTYSSNQFTFEHMFIIPKDVISSEELMWRINADCNENNQRDSSAESYVEAESECAADEIFVEDPENFQDIGSDGCDDPFEDGLGGCQETQNLGPDGCDDIFEDGDGGCLDAPDPNYFSGDPNGDNDNNGDNYDSSSNPDGTQGNGEYEVNEEFFDYPSGTPNVYDTGFCDRTNQIWDPYEAHLDLEDEPDGIWDDTEPYQDRNCNLTYDEGEKAEPEITQAQCEDTFNGIWGSGVESFSFCDLGNGVWDDAEVCQDGLETCNAKELYTLSDRPNSAVISYATFEGECSDDSFSSESSCLEEGHDWTITSTILEEPEAFEEVILNDDVMDRWGNIYENIIETIQDTSFKFETVDLIDSLVVVLSNPIIEQLDTPSSDYYIAKSEWYDDNVRDYDYHIFKHGDEGYIYKLIHQSYFLPPGFHDAFSEGGFWFENHAEDDVFLYTVNGMLRDGERYQTIRIDTTSIAEYLVEEFYAVDYEEVTVPMRQLLGEVNEDGNVICAADDVLCSDCSDVSDCSADTTFSDCFKVTREKTSTMLGTGVEYFEENITYFVRDYGIVKDDLEFRWNTPPGSSEELDGRYRWEMISNNVPETDCSDEGFLQTLIDRKKTISIDEFNQIDALNADPYKKTRTYGLQRVIDEDND